MEDIEQKHASQEIHIISDSKEELIESNSENVSLGEKYISSLGPSPRAREEVITESARDVLGDNKSFTNVADPEQNNDKIFTENKPRKRVSIEATKKRTPAKKLKLNKGVKISSSDDLNEDYKSGIAVADPKSYKKKASRKNKEQYGTIHDSGNSTLSERSNENDFLDIRSGSVIDNNSSLGPNNNLLASDTSSCDIPKGNFTSSNDPQVPSKSKPLRTTVWGNEYQRIIQILLRQRGTKSSSVAIEVSGVGILDDIVYAVEKEKRCRLFQVKYSNSESTRKVTTSELLSTDWTDINPKKLYLLQYFASFCAIKENYKYAEMKIEELTCVTNCELVCSQIPIEYLSDVDLKKDDLLNFGECEAVKYAISKHFYEKAGEKLKSLCKKYLPTKIDKADEYISEFLEKIRVVVNYLDYEDARTRVFKEVFNDDSFDFEKCEILFCCVVYFETKLLMVKEKFITRDEWQNVIEELKEFINILKTTGISELKTRELIREVDDVVFDNESLKDISESIKTFLETIEQNVLCFSNAQNILFNAIKVLRSLDKISNNEEGGAKKFKFILCTIDTLLVANFLVDSFLSASTDLLVITCNSGYHDENTKKLTDELGKIKGTKKKIIIVSNGENCFVNKLKEIITGIVFCNNCNHTFRDLTSTSQEKILSYEITFQGQQLRLSSLFKNDIEFACHVLDENCLWEIVNKRKECVINNTEAFVSPGYDERYYIERCFYQNIVHPKEIRKRINQDIFLLTGSFRVGKESIEHILHKNDINMIHEWDASKSYSSGVIVSSQDLSHSIYEQLCNGSGNSNVHWIMMKSDRYLVHIDSKQPIKRIIKAEPEKENDFIKKPRCDKVSIIVSDSGVGKSTILTRICEKRKEQTYWLLKTDLNKVFKNIPLEKPEHYSSIENCVDFLENIFYSTKPGNCLERKLFRHILSPAQKNLALNTVLLLDGFNEIQPSLDFSVELTINDDVKIKQNVVYELIKTLRNHCNIEQIVITAQVQERIELEWNLQEPAYFLKHLERQEQKELMALYWAKEYNSRSPPLEIDLNDLRRDALDVIETWENTMSNEKDKSFTNVSLNVIMLAEVLIETDRRFSDTIVLKDLYGKFVSNKIDLYFKGQGECSEVIRAMTECDFRKIHQECSVKMVLPKLIDKLPGMRELDSYKRRVSVEVMTSTLAKIGLLIINKGNLSFTHDSFAQFFISEYIACNINLHSVQNLFIKYVLPLKNMKLCRKFLDTIYERQFAEKDDEKPTLSKDCKSSLNSSKSCTHLLPSLRENNPFLVGLVLELLDEDEMYDYVDKIVQEAFKKKSNEFKIGVQNRVTLLTKLKEIPVEKLQFELVKIIEGAYTLDESSADPSVLQDSPMRNDYTAHTWNGQDRPLLEKE